MTLDPDMLMAGAGRQAVVYTQETARLPGHPRIGGEHLPLALARETGEAR